MKDAIGRGCNLMDMNKTLERIRSILEGFEETETAYIFGSFLERDDFHDMDIALHLCKDEPPYQRSKLSKKIARSLERGISPRVEFDVRILDHAPACFQYEAISKGIVVLERDRERRINYEAQLISEYLDVKYMYDYLDQAFLARA